MTAVIKTHLPVFVVAAPLFVSFLLSPMARRFGWVQSLVVGVQGLGLLLAVYLAGMILKSSGVPIIYSMGGWPAPWGIELWTGSLGAFFLLVVAGVTLPISLYAVNNLSDEVGDATRSTRFFVLYLLLAGVLAGMALTNDLFNIFVLVEVATISCCGLVSARRGPNAAKAAFNYLILATLGSGLILGGIGLVYMITGNLNMGFAGIALKGVWQDYPHVVWMAMSFFLVGFGVKAALFPLHVWLPDAHSTAPTPASAILSGLAVKGYIICLVKILFGVFEVHLLDVFRLDQILVLLGMLAILAGSILALAQGELKRRLAFSTVAQVGYIVLGFGLMNIKGVAGTLFYLASHAVIKSTLFLAAGALISATGKTHVKDFAGVGRKMPITMGVFSIASLGLVGIPLFSGFVGKWYLLLGSLEVGNLTAAGVIGIGSVLCAIYLFPIIRTAYFEPAPEDDWQDPGVPQRLALVMLGIAVIGLGVLPGPLLQLAQKAAADLLIIP